MKGIPDDEISRGDKKMFDLIQRGVVKRIIWDCVANEVTGDEYGEENAEGEEEGKEEGGEGGEDVEAEEGKTQEQEEEKPIAQ